MTIPFAALAVSASLVAPIPVADRAAPKFDPGPGCRAVAASGLSMRNDVDGCIRSEEAARDELKSKWNTFPAEAKGRCVEKTFVGGPPSYIEVLVCLDLALAVKNMKKDENTKDENTGLATGLRRR